MKRASLAVAGLLAMGGSAAVLPAQAVGAAERPDQLIVLRMVGDMPDIEQMTPVDLSVLAEPAPLPLVGASYYGKRFAGRPTASGERFDPTQLTAAHRTLPFGTMVKVTNPTNGKTVTVRINDRGPFHHSRDIDLSRAAAEQIGMIQRGHAKVTLETLD